MSILGIRCSNKDFTFAVMAGSKSSPRLQHTNTVALPKSFSRPRALFWMVQEAEELLNKHHVRKVVIKGFEGRARGKTYAERVEMESAVFIASGKNGLNAVYRKVKSTIAKDLGLKGRGHYLQTGLDTSVIPGFNQKSEKEKDAILAGWSEL